MSILKKQLSMMPLLKAQKSFNTFRTRLTDDQLKAGALKAFEYCVELSLKTIQDYLEIYETAEAMSGFRDTVRVAARFGLIKDAELWFKFIESRNALLHAYEETVVTAAVDLFPSFSIEVEDVTAEMVYRMSCRGVR